MPVVPKVAQRFVKLANGIQNTLVHHDGRHHHHLIQQAAVTGVFIELHVTEEVRRIAAVVRYLSPSLSARGQ